jgi:hypothetical protein
MLLAAYTTLLRTVTAARKPPKRAAQLGDLFLPVLGGKQYLPSFSTVTNTH